MSYLSSYQSQNMVFGGVIVLGVVVQIGFQLPYLREVGFHWRFDFRLSEKVKRALKLLVPTLFGAGVYQVNVFVSQAIAWGAGDGAVSSLQFSNRLLELTLGVFVVALSTAILRTTRRSAAEAASG